MKHLLLSIFLFVTVVSFGQTPVLPNDPFIPAGTVIKKVSGVPGSFVYAEVTDSGAPLFESNSGLRDVATPTFTIDDVTPVALSAYLPINTIGFEIRAASGSFIINHPGCIATGTARVGRLVSQGETYTWNGLAGTFNGVVLGTATSTNLVIDGAWGGE